MGSLTTVEFRGDTLFAVEREDGVFVAVKPISDQLGLDWSGQHQRIKRTPALMEGMGVIPIPSVGGTQETVCLRLNLINGWLFTIDSSRVKPELRECVLAYQRECYDVLADHFLGPRAAARPIRMPEAGQDTEYRRRLGTVSEARRLYGAERARLLYEALRLPEVPELPASPPAAAAPGKPAAIDPAELAEEIGDFLRRGRDVGLIPAAEAGDPDTWARRGVVGFSTPEGTIHLRDAGWRSAIGDRDPAAAADALARAGLLIKSSEGRRKAVVRIAGRPIRAYCLRPQILDEGVSPRSFHPRVPGTSKVCVSYEYLQRFWLGSAHIKPQSRSR